MVNVVGTSTCIIAIAPAPELIPARGVIEGVRAPDDAGIEAGLSATGDIFEAIAKRAGSTVAGAFAAAWKITARGRPVCCGATWDNGDRTVLVNPSWAV